MSMLTWAEQEVKIACEREAPGRKNNEWDYGCACYESALKAYKSLIEDGHSGFSWSITKHILMRLMEDKPLTPIEDKPEVWKDVTCKNEEGKLYQCKRMSSLFKHVRPNGSIYYDDIARVTMHEINTDTNWNSKTARDIINEMFPITMPYIPQDKQYVVEATEYLSDRKNGDFDTVNYKFVTCPDGEIRHIERAFGETKDGWKEIDMTELVKRIQMHYERERKEHNEDNKRKG